jgi:hypothetical protein
LLRWKGQVGSVEGLAWCAGQGAQLSPDIGELGDGGTDPSARGIGRAIGLVLGVGAQLLVDVGEPGDGPGDRGAGTALSIDSRTLDAWGIGR